MLDLQVSDILMLGFIAYIFYGSSQASNCNYGNITINHGTINHGTINRGTINRALASNPYWKPKEGTINNNPDATRNNEFRRMGWYQPN